MVTRNPSSCKSGILLGCDHHVSAVYLSFHPSSQRLSWGGIWVLSCIGPGGWCVPEILDRSTQPFLKCSLILQGWVGRPAEKMALSKSCGLWLQIPVCWEGRETTKLCGEAAEQLVHRILLNAQYFLSFVSQHLLHSLLECTLGCRVAGAL